MPISINGTGTITGISAGGLPDDCITTAEIAGSAVTTAKLSQPMTLGSAQTATGSNTFFDFTGIPSWVKRITVMFNGVSTNGNSGTLIQIGTSGGVVNSGYLSTSVGAAASAGVADYTTGFGIRNDSSAYVMSGHMVITSISGNIWISSHVTKVSTIVCPLGGGSVTLGGTLDRVRLTTANGTDTFDAGSVNVMYEG